MYKFCMDCIEENARVARQKNECSVHIRLFADDEARLFIYMDLGVRLFIYANIEARLFIYLVFRTRIFIYKNSQAPPSI